VKVNEVTADAIVTDGGERIEAELRLWAAGVKGALPRMQALQQVVAVPRRRSENKAPGGHRRCSAFARRAALVLGP